MNKLNIKKKTNSSLYYLFIINERRRRAAQKNLRGRGGYCGGCIANKPNFFLIFGCGDQKVEGGIYLIHCEGCKKRLFQDILNKILV